MIYDLSLMIEDSMEVYPGDPAVRIREVLTVEKDGSSVRSLALGTHTATHVDAPLHFIPGGESVDEIPLSRFWGTAAVIRPDMAVPKAEVILVALAGEDGEYPVMAEELAARIAAVPGIKAVGVDVPSVDRDGRVHRLFLGQGIAVYESLTGLGRLVGKRGLFWGFPLKIAGADGSPVRAVFAEEGFFEKISNSS